jgi:hypothetical protein
LEDVSDPLFEYAQVVTLHILEDAVKDVDEC